MTFPADLTLLAPDQFEPSAVQAMPCKQLRAHTNDLATDPCVSAAVMIATKPGKLPAAVLGMISQQLANGVTRKMAAQPDPLHLVFDTSNGHRRPA